MSKQYWSNNYWPRNFWDRNFIYWGRKIIDGVRGLMTAATWRLLRRNDRL